MSSATTTLDSPDAAGATQATSPMIAAGRAQFLADFPRLLAHRKAHPEVRWVAYHGSNQIGLGTSKAELVRLCLARGFAAGEFLVLGIDPATADPNA